jgi:haloalkane dehalogenase
LDTVTVTVTVTDTGLMKLSKDIYPFEGRYLDRQGLRLHYLDEGSGPTVVMVHGNPSWSIYYRNLVQALRGGHRCIVPDHMGCGLSDKPGDDRYTYTLQSRVDDLDALIAHTAPEGELTLVVHDWGGMIGFAWAVQHPERIARLVVLNTAAFHNPRGLKVPFPLWLARNTGVGSFLVRRLNAFARGATSMAVRKPMSAEVKAAYLAPYDTPDHRIATLRFVQDIPLKQGDPAWDVVSHTENNLGKLAQVPTLICWGMQDFVFDPVFLEAWRRHLPEAEVHEFPHAGHYVLEDAGERIVPLIQRFLAQGQA